MSDSPSPSAVRRTAANAASLVAAYVIGRGLAFVAVVVAARAVGAEAFGTYGAAAALAVVLSLVSTLGMVPLLVREMARAPEDASRWLAASDRVKHGSNLLMMTGLALVGGPLFGWSSQALGSALLLGAGYALGSYVENRLAWSRAVERMTLVTSTTAIFGLVTGTLGVVVIWATGSVLAFCAAPVVGQAAALAWAGGQVPARVRGGKVVAGDVSRLVRAVGPFAAAFVALTMFYKVDVLVLDRLRSREDVGLYSAAYRFVDLAHALTLAGVGAVYPALVRHTERGGGAPGRIGGRAGELALLVSAPAAAALWLARRSAMVGLFGSDFAAAVPTLAALAPAIPPLAFNLYAGHLFGAAGRMRWMAALYGMATVLKLGLDVWLIPTYGALGAGLAALVAEVGLATGFWVALGHVLGAAPGFRSLGALAMVGGITWGVSFLPDPSGGTLRVGALILCTLAVYRTAGVIPAEEWASLRGAMGRRGRIPGRAVDEDGPG